MEPHALVAAARRVPRHQLAVRAFIEETRGEDYLFAVEAAIETADERATTVLAVAAAATGNVPDAALLRRVLPLAEHIAVAIALVKACPDDPLPMLIDLAASEALSHERESAVLWAAVRRLEGRPAPRDLVARLRLHARRGLGPEAAAVLVLAARAVGDPDLLSIAEPWIEATAGPLIEEADDNVETMWEKTPLEALDETQPFVGAASTIRREVPKIGRNDPCFCGSGRKFKKCCEGKKVASPPPPDSSLMHARLPDGEFRRLRPAVLAQIPLDSLPTRRVIDAFRTFVRYRRWSDAERALGILDRRTDLPEQSTSDGYRIDLIREAITAGVREVVRRELARVSDRSMLTPSLELDVALLENPSAALPRIEAQAERGLRGEDEDLIELAYSLLQHSPALGILVARGVVTPQRGLDSTMLVETVEEARDRLGLPPGDDAGEILDLMEGRLLDDQVAASNRTNDAKLKEEAEDLREKTLRASERIAALEAELWSKSVELERARKSRVAPAAPGHATPAPGSGEEVSRLRAKVEELKGLIRDGNETRSELRRQVASLGERLSAADRESVGEETREDHEGDDLERDAPPMRLRVLVPEFDRDARHALQTVPAAVAAKALDVVSALAGADASAWHGVKALEAVPNVRSARVGIHYRILFEVKSDERELRVLDIVPRGGLATAIKRWRR